MQVTADGVPVIWHDDLVVSLPEQASDAVRTQHICELSLRDFKKLSQHRPVGTQTASSSSSSTFEAAPFSQCSSQSAALTDAATQQAQHEQSANSAQSSASAPSARLARFFSSDQGKRMHSAQAWAVSEEDSLPTLAEVFKVCCSKPAFSRSLYAWHSSGHTKCDPVKKASDGICASLHITEACQCCGLCICTHEHMIACGSARRT